MVLQAPETDKPNYRRAMVHRAARSVPTLFVVYRFVAAPLLFLAAREGMTGWFLIGFFAAGATDLFDGVIARRLNVVSQGLREWDGRVDVWFYAWIAAAIWVVHPEVFVTFGTGLLWVVALQVAAWTVDFIKFRRFSNYHAYSAKALGCSLFVAILALFAIGGAGILMWLVIVTGTVCMLEEIAITLILPRWTFDVWSVRHALRLRTEGVQNAVH